MSDTPKRGDLRIMADGSGRWPSVDVWDGQEWLKVPAVQEVRFRFSYDDTLSKVELDICPIGVRISTRTPAERVAGTIVGLPFWPPREGEPA